MNDLLVIFSTPPFFFSFLMWIVKRSFSLVLPLRFPFIILVYIMVLFFFCFFPAQLQACLHMLYPFYCADFNVTIDLTLPQYITYHDIFLLLLALCMFSFCWTLLSPICFPTGFYFLFFPIDNYFCTENLSIFFLFLSHCLIEFVCE